MMNASITAAVFKTHEEAQRGVRALSDAGIDLRRISIVGKDVEINERAVSISQLGDRIRSVGSWGAFGGALVGVLIDPFVRFFPIFGHLLVLGPLASAVVSGLEGAVVGGFAGSIVGALISIGTRVDRTIRFESEIRPNKYLVTVEGSHVDIDLCRNVLGTLQADELEVHDVFAKRPSLNQIAIL